MTPLDGAPRTEPIEPYQPLEIRRYPVHPNWLLLAVAVLYPVVVVVATWVLFAPGGPYANPFGTLAGLEEYLNEVIGQGTHAGEAGSAWLVLGVVVPAVFGAIARSWHFVWIAPLGILLADLMLRVAARLASLPDPFAATALALLADLLIFGVPAMIAAAVGTVAGRLIERLVRR